MEELGVFISRESGVIALAITPPGVLETFRFLERLQPRFETVLWLGPYRAADEYSQLWKRHILMPKEDIWDI
ncbi:hypothetical protein JP39_02305 [Companilactobacillus heilongjiangensis]|uniref:Uncharacterized protein n=1 Tax=Companilactobacillus heilongjiangensis TaxID=1074467 RepID=A0A0K2LAI8_9LACO|nr:hypothetical protein JP39_02305 [Companilactobacillus heilongjiangensis]